MKRSFFTVIIFIQIFCLYGYAQENRLGQKVVLNPGITKTTDELMSQWEVVLPPEFEMHNFELELEQPDRSNLPQASGVIESSQWPPLNSNSVKHGGFAFSPQTLGISFTGATLSDALAYPPDVMGDVGPTQFVVFINGRLRSFNKTTGSADGVLNINPDTFFSSIVTPPGSNQTSFTSDPNVRYDRLTGRWFLTIIDVTVNNFTGSIANSNRILIAFSDGGNISGSTVWTFYYYQNSSNFSDYPSLGIDANALYIGTDQFSLRGTFVNTNAYVFNKASLINNTPTVTVFSNLISGSTGPFAPRGVDNPDPNNTGSSAVGYFIGVDYGAFSKLDLRRISDPGGTPTISSNISFSTTISTQFPVLVPHLGNTNGSSGRLDALDDRLFAAHIINGNLWTAHNIGVDNTGTTAGQNRNAARWYEIQNLNSTPSVHQAGTLYDNSSPNDANQRNYWIPSIMASGQGHAVLGCSIAGSNEYINAFTTGRLSGDPLGTLSEGPGGSSLSGYTSSTTAYNPPGNPGGSSGRRWGDYSITCLDPEDNMTMWTIQEFCNATNSWGVKVVQLKAPPPVTPTNCNPSSVAPGQNSINIVVTGTSSNGSGFYDPGSGFTKRISASLTGGITVNLIAYNSPTQVTLNISTVGVSSGYYDLTITNPDGQTASGMGILQVDSGLPVELSTFTAFLYNNNIRLKWKTETEVNNYGFEVERKDKTIDWEKIGFVKGHGNSNSEHQYQFTDKNYPSGKDIQYRLKQIDNDGNYGYSKIVEVKISSSSYSLKQNYPNPFNPTTKITYIIPPTENGLMVKLKVYDVLGKEVSTLVNERENGGSKQVEFNGLSLPSGIYIYKLQAGGFVKTMKMVLLK